MCVCVCTCSCVFIYIWNQVDTKSLQSLSASVFETGPLNKPGHINSFRLADIQERSICLHSQTLRLQLHAVVPGFLHECWG